ncbi:hypothetical protein HPC49_00190 [Pyxidicoccus fallax]|uniref:Outer membrane protein beta-barrel domain-containing protein n=1 Tax=Pyxidicoccus fallax TaxID=394095 RepID=A0A848LAW9_9BACT|nr:hypothetical protein [Pyxidicoccus fallax]NMO13995.1 hypothetical protein [Pyxidicoccus fallax]NPC76673.1 hypothetical protein [Pyxidicoccus fallax]
MQANKWQFLAAVAGLMVSLNAGAQETGGAFGSPGRLVIGTDASASLGYGTYGESDVGFFVLEPSADYFIKQNLSVGSALRIRAYFGDADATAIGLNVRGGYNIPVGDRVSVWPKVGLTLQLGDEQVLPLAGVLPTDATLAFDIYAPFLFHLTNNFFVGGGPRLDLGIGDDVGVVFGLFSTIGGHF